MGERLTVRPVAASPGWLPKLGLLLLILALVSPFLTAFVVAADMPREVRAALAGFLLFGLPMALLLLIVAMLGQPAFAFIKRRIAGQDSPPASVGVARYRVGLVLVIIPLLVSWLEPFVSPHYPLIAARRVLIGGLADGVVLVGLFVLGGAFWDKLHALFVHDARVAPEAQGPVVATAELVLLGWRFYVGVAVLLCSVLSWGLVPIASAAGWSTAQMASLTGGIMIANKVLLFGAIAIMGKPGFNHLKGMLFGFMSRFAPARQVSPGRYQLGLLLFLVPLLMTWVAPYVSGLVVPGSVYGFLQEIALEVLLLVGLFVLGGEFWDKIRALFQHRAKVDFPGRAT